MPATQSVVDGNPELGKGKVKEPPRAPVQICRKIPTFGKKKLFSQANLVSRSRQQQVKSCKVLPGTWKAQNRSGPHNMYGGGGNSRLDSLPRGKRGSKRA